MILNLIIFQCPGLRVMASGFCNGSTAPKYTIFPIKMASQQWAAVLNHWSPISEPLQYPPKLPIKGQLDIFSTTLPPIILPAGRRSPSPATILDFNYPNGNVCRTDI